MTERIRTTISLTPEAYEVFKRMAAATNMSVSRAMGDWLTDTADAAMMITTKMEEAKSAPVRVMRELQAMVAGIVTNTKKKASRDAKLMSAIDPKWADRKVTKFLESP